jgi:hypothetical protein
MISCADAAELISRSLDTKLSWWQRLALRIHLYGCDLCRRFRRQSRMVDQAGRRLGQGENADDPGFRLSEEARERIRAAVAQANQDGPK